MEHEVFVPVPAERLGDVLADPVRVARAVPGLQQDAGAEPVAGRLKVRVGSHSITYRGALRLTARDDGTYAVEGEATESRGTGTVALALTLRVADADGGCTLVISGTATADGRVSELPADAVTASATRLLTRFAENLGVAAERGWSPGLGLGLGPAPGLGRRPGKGPRPRRGPRPGRRPRPSRAPSPSPGPRPSRRPRPDPRGNPGPSTSPSSTPRSPVLPRGRGGGDRRRAPRTGRAGRPGGPRPPGAARRGRARAPHDDRAQRRGGGPRPAPRPVRPVPAPQAGAAGAPALGRAGGGTGRGVRDRRGPRPAQAPLSRSGTTTARPPYRRRTGAPLIVPVGSWREQRTHHADRG